MGDSIFIFLLALMLLGPKKLPQLARQLGKLMAEFRKASNDFRMQMEDELRLEEQKDHQAKVNALAPPPSSMPDPNIPTEEPPHPHLPAPLPETAVEPIAESGRLRMMPPSTGLPAESSVRGTGYTPTNGLPSIPEHSIGDAIDDTSMGAGATSEEPVAELQPPPDRGHPVMAGEGERATHV